MSDRTSFEVVERAWHADGKDGMEAHQLRRSLFNISKALSVNGIRNTLVLLRLKL